jgi:hypothetical protein
MFPNETPWPGLNNFTADSMPGLRREFQKNDRLATHTALGELFIPDEFRNCKWVFARWSCRGEGVAKLTRRLLPPAVEGSAV